MSASHPLRPRVLSCALALTLAACASDGPVDTATAYRDAPLLELHETQRFCTDERIAACQLGPSAFASVAPDGGVIFGMPSGPVARFDSAGTFVAEYGRAGGGPGEYRRLRGAHVLPDGRVVLHDGHTRRLLFKADGTPLATVSEDQGLGVRELSLEPRGLSIISDPPAAVGDSVSSEVRLLRDTLPATVVARVPLTRRSDATGGSPMIAFFEDRPRWAIESDSSALLTMGPVLNVRRYFPDGRAVDVVHAPELGNRAVTPADIEAERVRRGAPTGPIPPQMRQPLLAAMADAEARAATVHPFAAGLRVLHDGAFLLREAEVRADSVRWTLFERDGAVLGQLRLPELAAVVGGRRDRLLVMMPDANDVPAVGWFGVGARE